MGYTHYFSQLRDVTHEEWGRIRTLTDTLIRKLPPGVRIDDQDGGPPLVNQECIWFNGIEDEGCETFELTRVKRPLRDYELQELKAATPSTRRQLEAAGAFNFCKTRREPYDLVVCAVLAIATYVTRRDPAWRISSDGEPDEWQPALDWATKTLGFRVPSPLEPPCEVVGDVSET